MLTTEQREARIKARQEAEVRKQANFFITEMNYQRNGIAGEGFYTAMLTSIDPEENYQGLMATFQTEEKETRDRYLKENPYSQAYLDIGDGEFIYYPTCRVVNPLNIHNGWRGDNIAYDIAKKVVELKKRYGLDRLYSLAERINEDRVMGMLSSLSKEWQALADKHTKQEKIFKAKETEGSA